jgi:hypothetical protein
MATGYWSEMWREWFRPLSKDFLKTLSVLAVLFALWKVVALMRWAGYPDEYASAFEKTHFAFMWVIWAILGGNFVVKQVVGLWKKPRKH